MTGHETRFPYWLIERWLCLHCWGAMRGYLGQSRREAWQTARDCVRGAQNGTQ